MSEWLKQYVAFLALSALLSAGAMFVIACLAERDSVAHAQEAAPARDSLEHREVKALEDIARTLKRMEQKQCR